MLHAFVTAHILLSVMLWNSGPCLKALKFFCSLNTALPKLHAEMSIIKEYISGTFLRVLLGGAPLNTKIVLRKAQDWVCFLLMKSMFSSRMDFMEKRTIPIVASIMIQFQICLGMYGETDIHLIMSPCPHMFRLINAWIYFLVIFSQ